MSSSSSSSSSVVLGKYKNKTKVLVLSTRGVLTRQRHLMNDIRELLPHAKKDAKMEKKDSFAELNDVCDVHNCNACLFFEARKRLDLYLWAALVPGGPTARFLVTNIHTMDELKLTGNCLKGSRPFISFDAAFDGAPHLRVYKSLLSQIFGTPKFHPRSKPFFDHVITFSLVDDRIWFRHYQVLHQSVARNKVKRTLVEIGPRFVLQPIRIYARGFSGQILYDNPEYISPNVHRQFERLKAAGKYAERKDATAEREARAPDLVLPPDEVRDVFKQKLDDEQDFASVFGRDFSDDDGDDQDDSE
jgi:ribosome biogenesis protein BRX1